MVRISMTLAAAGVVAVMFGFANGHAVMSHPITRGFLRSDPAQNFHYTPHYNGWQCDNIDYCPMCQNANFLNKRSNGETFSPYTPMDRTRSIRGNFGMCGDEQAGNMHADHMKLGYYSEGCVGMPTATGLYPGGHIDIQIQSTAHHQGFFEFFLCDTSTCGGDISRNCFYDNKCVQLTRVKVSHCENGHNRKCAPVDNNYPGRWYIPCPEYPFLFTGTAEMTRDQTLGGPDGTMKYKIPEDFNCGKNCVLQSYWATSNVCNPKGMVPYFDDLYGRGLLSSWKGCPGDGNSRGGYLRTQFVCGEGDQRVFPEEFWNCADIHMEGNNFNNHKYDGYYRPGNEGKKTWIQSTVVGGGPLPAFDPNAAIDCYQNNERAMGAQGYPSVTYKPCCDANAQLLENPQLGWGKFCIGSVATSGGSSSNGANCYENDQKAHGASGEPYHPWKPCCDSEAKQVERSDLGPGKWCTRDTGNCYPNNHKAQGGYGEPYHQWKPCCDSSAQQVERPEFGAGKYCTVAGGGTSGNNGEPACITCLRGGGHCSSCKHPYDMRNRKWFISGPTRHHGSWEFQICLEHSNTDHSQECWWCNAASSNASCQP